MFRAAGLGSRRLAAALALLVTASGASAQATQSDIPAAARQTIAAANADWLTAMKRGDVATVVAPYADDGVFVTANGDVFRGRAAIEQMMRDRFAASGTPTSGTIVQDGITRAGTAIYEWGHAQLVYTKGGSTPTTTVGRYLTVWAPDASGRWSITRNVSLRD